MSRFKRGDDARKISGAPTATKLCDVCGRQRPVNGFGDGVRLPKGTCVACGESVKIETERRKIELKRMGSD